MAPYYDAAVRAQVIALRDFGASIKEVAARTGVQERTQRKIITRAKERGFVSGNKVLDLHVEDGQKPGAPLKRTPLITEELVKEVRGDRYSKEKSNQQLAEDFCNEGSQISA